MKSNYGSPPTPTPTPNPIASIPQSNELLKMQTNPRTTENPTQNLTTTHHFNLTPFFLDAVLPLRLQPPLVTDDFNDFEQQNQEVYSSWTLVGRHLTWRHNLSPIIPPLGSTLTQEKWKASCRERPDQTANRLRRLSRAGWRVPSLKRYSQTQTPALSYRN